LNKNSLKRKRFKENGSKKIDKKRKILKFTVTCINSNSRIQLYKKKKKNICRQFYYKEKTKPNHSVGLKGFSHERKMRISKSNTKKNGD
jgi:hypothetical protein